MPEALIPSHLATVEQWYTVRDRPGTMEFLAKQPRLAAFLQDARPVIGRYFPDSPVSLRLVTDPAVGGDEHHVLSIGTRLSPHDALNQLHLLENSREIHTADRAESALSINVDFL